MFCPQHGNRATETCICNVAASLGLGPSMLPTNLILCCPAVLQAAGNDALLEMEHAGASLLQSSQLAPVRALKLRQQQQEAWRQRYPEGWEGGAEP